MLRRLASLAMRLAEEVCERAINSPHHPEPVHEPARAFATVSRALRLTVVLQARFEADWFAFRDTGELPTGLVFNPKPRGAGKVAVSETTSLDDRDDDALETLDRARESLHEYERFDEILSVPSTTVSPLSAPTSASNRGAMFGRRARTLLFPRMARPLRSSPTQSASRHRQTV